eukprot:10382740-Prorocentrum_lima.AAC.1
MKCTKDCQPSSPPEISQAHTPPPGLHSCCGICYRGGAGTRIRTCAFYLGRKPGRWATGGQTGHATG